MVPVKRVLPLLLAVACGGPEFDTLSRTRSEDAVVFTCPDGAFVSFPIVRITGVPDMTPNLEASLGCLGIGERCPDGTPLPDDPMCDDANVTPNDGCEPTCDITPGYECVGEPSVCTRDCSEPCGNSCPASG